LQIGDMTDSSIHHNIIREHRGAYGIKTWKAAWSQRMQSWDWLKQNKARLVRVRFHDNDIKVRQRGGWGTGQPNMAVELWNSDPVECDFSRNRLNECLSLIEGGEAPHTIRVHHNRFILEPGYSCAIEAGHHDLEIDHNIFRNGYYPIGSFGSPIRNLRVHHNTFDGIEDIALCILPGVSGFDFRDNTVLVRREMPVLILGKDNNTGRPTLSRDITITGNRFSAQGPSPSRAPIIKLRDRSTIQPDGPRIWNNSFRNWIPEQAILP
jgi:hypothetical protein